MTPASAPDQTRAVTAAAGEQGELTAANFKVSAVFERKLHTVTTTGVDRGGRAGKGRNESSDRAPPAQLSLGGRSGSL